MICEQCQKREATVHLTDMSEGHATEGHLCDSCAYPGRSGFPPVFSPTEISIDVFEGGPSKGKAVRIRHIQTGIVVQCEGKVSDELARLIKLAEKVLQARLKEKSQER